MKRAGSLVTVVAAQRYLTPERKASILSEWESTLRSTANKDHPGGRGYPDQDMIPWCERINALPGICTLQSCTGHVRRPGHVMMPGQLWLAVDEPTSQAFDRRAFELSAQNGMERVYRLYSSWGQEIIDITFAGNKRGRFHTSMETICAFLESLC